MSKPTTAFIIDRMFPDEDWTIRICIPGIDTDRTAVWLDTTCKRETKAEAEALLTAILDGLKDITRES